MRIKFEHCRECHVSLRVINNWNNHHCAPNVYTSLVPLSYESAILRR